MQQYRISMVNEPEKTFYHQQVIKIRGAIFSKDYLYNQSIEAKLFIDKHFADGIKLDDIAGKAFFSKYHFIRLFKTIYGKTPYQYLISVRIKKAKQLLQAGKTVSEVCSHIGFGSVTSFTGLFKKMTGSTPAAFIKKQRKQKSHAVLPLKSIPYCPAENDCK